MLVIVIALLLLLVAQAPPAVLPLDEAITLATETPPIAPTPPGLSYVFAPAVFQQLPPSPTPSSTDTPESPLQTPTPTNTPPAP